MEEKNNKTNTDDLVQNTIKNLSNLVQKNIVIGDAINLGNNYIVPISKISCGFVSGGGDLDNKKGNNFMGASCSGFNIDPIGVVAVSNNDISILEINKHNKNKEIIELSSKLLKILIKKMGEENDKKN